MMRSLSRCGPALAVLTAILVSTAGCEQTENKFVPPPPPQVTVSRPEQRPVTDYLHLTGNTQAVDQVQLDARVEGFLTSIHFKDGDYVKKGDLLFLIEQDMYKAKVQQAEGQLAAAQAQLLRASQEYDRQLSLLKQNATAKSEVEKWKAERDAAEASIVETKANLELSRINLGYTRVTAPFDGRMDRHLVTPGNLVGASGPTALAIITRMDPIYAYFTLNERDLVRLAEKAREKGQASQGYKATPVFAGIEGGEGYPHEGRLDFISTSLDPNTGTLLLRAIFDNPLSSGGAPRLVPGMFVRLRIPVDVREKALLVSERALGVDQGGRYVLVINDKDVVEQRSVKVGAQVNDMRVIEEGLMADDRVVVSGIQRARPGAKVTPVQEGTATAPAAASPAASPTKP
ncbi:MAG: efflux RND transporter periplasmic adaptor subunit [Hyphomicrobiales bacterium]